MTSIKASTSLRDPLTVNTANIGTLNVSGASTFSGTTSFVGSVIFSGTTNLLIGISGISDPLTINRINVGTLNVSGTATFSGTNTIMQIANIVSGTMTNLASSAAIITSGTFTNLLATTSTLTTLTAPTANLGALNVSGTSTFSGAVNVIGTTSLSGSTAILKLTGINWVGSLTTTAGSGAATFSTSGGFAAPQGFITVDVSGASRKIPFYNT